MECTWWVRERETGTAAFMAPQTSDSTLSEPPVLQLDWMT